MNEFLSLSKYYDLFMENNDVEKWKHYVVKTIKRYSKGNNGADIGSGTGTFTRALAYENLNVIGVEPSIAMLNEALSLSENITYVKGSMNSFKKEDEFDFITAINDVVNYIPKEKLSKAFFNVYKSLKKNGIFMFDISSEYKLKNIIGNNLFSEDTEEVTYLWFNTLKKDRVIMDMTFFIKENMSYLRKDEAYTEYIYTVEEIEKELKSIGFIIIKEEGHLGRKLSGNSERINFIVKKV